MLITFKLKAIQYLDDSFFKKIDNVSSTSKESKNKISYDVNYDKETNTFIFVMPTEDKYDNESRTEIIGAPFIDENGEVDVLFLDKEEVVLLIENKLAYGVTRNFGEGILKL